MASRGPNGLEVRSAVEVRAAGRKLYGTAAPFNSPAQVGPWVETIMPGAFARTLRSGQDIVALADHSPDKLLARTVNGSLRLAETAAGLQFELDVPQTQLGADMLAMAEAGLLGGVSIGFRLAASGGDTWPTPTTRHLLNVDLCELSLIQAFPAYAATSVQARFRSTSIDPARARRLALLGVG